MAHSFVFVSIRPLDGQKFMALNGGPDFFFTPAISFFVNCGDKLSAGGEKGRCGWLKDNYGVMKAMLQMDKLDIKTLKEAAG